MKLKALSLQDLEQVRQWRNEQSAMLRTPFLLTKEQQEQFYREVICDRQANARYWGIWANVPAEVVLYSDKKEIERYKNGEKTNLLIGMVGLENIQWENRLAEISLLLLPNTMEEYGAEALRLILHEGFMNMNLDNIYTEVYGCNPAFVFWNAIATEYDCITSILPNRKYYNGEYWYSHYINFEREDFLEHENTLLKPAQTVN